jgi:hypothetical protein
LFQAHLNSPCFTRHTNFGFARRNGEGMKRIPKALRRLGIDEFGPVTFELPSANAGDWL